MLRPDTCQCCTKNNESYTGSCSDNLEDSCCSGECIGAFGSSCIGLTVGKPCTFNEQCASGKCQTFALDGSGNRSCSPP
jgi:hypothetical protein